MFLPGASQGWGSLVGCRLWGCTESDTTEATWQQQQQQQTQIKHRHNTYMAKDFLNMEVTLELSIGFRNTTTKNLNSKETEQ